MRVLPTDDQAMCCELRVEESETTMLISRADMSQSLDKIHGWGGGPAMQGE